MIKTDTINWHFESSILWSQEVLPTVDAKLRSWEKNSIEIEDDIQSLSQGHLNLWNLPPASFRFSRCWITVSKGGFTISSAEDVFDVLIRRNEGNDPIVYDGMTLASFLYIRPQLVDIDSIEKKFGQDGVKECILGVLLSSVALINSLFHEPEYCLTLRTKNTKSGSYLFSSTIFQGDVYWNKVYKFPASIHPNPKLLYMDVRRVSTEVVRRYLGKYLEKRPI
jgi:hypothetical protein